MHILVINCGSSSIKAAVVNEQTGERAIELKVERLGPVSYTHLTLPTTPYV